MSYQFFFKKLQFDDIAPVAMSQNPRKASNASWRIIDLMRFPVNNNNEQYLRLSDRIFTSLDQKSIVLIREYDNTCQHYHHQNDQTKYRNWVPQQQQGFSELINFKTVIMMKLC